MWNMKKFFENPMSRLYFMAGVYAVTL